MCNRITDWQVKRDGDRILLGLAVQSAVLDVLTDRKMLASCLTLLEDSKKGLTHQSMGIFGTHPVRLNIHSDQTVSLFVDRPSFDTSRNQSMAIWVDKENLQQILVDVIQK